MPTTPAAIPVEETAAHHSEYDPTVPLTDIEAHPSNVRRDAVADDELVNSIRAGGVFEPVVVAPHPDPDSPFKWRLIMGHRRKDGSEKAGHTSIPALIRYDLVNEDDQIAAMLVENGRRNGLTPIEEAAGFDTLADEHGWDLERIATTYGCSVATVKARRKLTRLQPTFQEQVSAGQVTINDALALAALPDAEQKRLEKVPADQVPYELKRSKARVDQQREVDKDIRELKAIGAVELEMPKGGYYWNLNDARDGMTPLGTLPLPLRERAAHSTLKRTVPCLGFLDTGTAQYPAIGLVCTNVSAHDDEIAAHQAEVAAARTEEEKQRDAERAARAAEDEAKRNEREADREARRVAAQMRGDVIIEGTRKVKIPALLEPVLRGALIGFLNDWPLDERLYQDLAGVTNDARWTSYEGRNAYVDEICALQGPALWRAFVAAIVAHVEVGVDYTITSGLSANDDAAWEALVFSDYLNALTLAGHQLTPPDEALRRAVLGDDEGSGA